MRNYFFKKKKIWIHSNPHIKTKEKIEDFLMNILIISIHPKHIMIIVIIYEWFYKLIKGLKL